MTLPLGNFRLLRATTVEDAAAMRHDHDGSRFLAGGTDLVVNLRRGLGCPPVLIDLGGIPELGMLTSTDTGTDIGAGITLAELAASATIRERHPAIAEAAATIAGPSHRNLATVGGNLCLDTRCIYYNQSAWWRHANGNCLKYGGDICHVAPQGQRCHAAFCGDLAPALLALGAEVQIASRSGRRRVPLDNLYTGDGRAHLALVADELLVSVHLPPDRRRSAYAKVRVRGSMDFPLAGVAVALAVDGKGLSALRIGLTGTNSRPFLLDGTDSLLGRPVDEATLKQLGKLVQRQVQPVRTTLASANYRRLAAAALAQRLTAKLATESAART